MLTLDQAKAHLKIPLTDVSEDELLGLYLASVQGTFATLSKRRWPEVGEPALTVVIDPAATPLTYRFVRFLDPAVLTAAEQATATQWLLLMLGHWYGNREAVAVGLNVTEVPHTADMLMKLLREPTI